MAGLAGFEPTNGGIKNRCLTTWRQPKDALQKNGALGEIRTHDPCLRRAILYPAELQAPGSTFIKAKFIIPIFCEKASGFWKRPARGGIRRPSARPAVAVLNLLRNGQRKIRPLQKPRRIGGVSNRIRFYFCDFCGWSGCGRRCGGRVGTLISTRILSRSAAMTLGAFCSISPWRSMPSTSSNDGACVTRLSSTCTTW